MRTLFLSLLLASLLGNLQAQNTKGERAPKTPTTKVKPGNPPKGETPNGYTLAMQKLQQTMFLFQNKYMEDVDLGNAAENAIKGMLEQLDPHSVYISAEDYQKTNEPLAGKFEGIGVSFNLIRDTILVVSVVQDGPSEKVGILAGDQITSVDGQNVAGINITNSDVQKKLRGAKGTEVNVGIKRRNESKTLDFTIVRDEIPLYSIDATYMASPGVGYIKVSRFATTTSEEFKSALEKLKAEKMKSLVLDLRGNGGGMMVSAVDMANHFLSDNKDIVYTEGKHSKKEVYVSESQGSFREGRLVVLIDEGSASASEIVSGAVQDWDRGLLVGRRTFGKGLVQRPFMLPDSSYIRLTVAHYYTPSGRCIQKPYEDGLDAYQKDLQKRIENGELTDKKQIDFPDSLKYYTKNKKRLVYGGGGIMPDVFVPIDTSFQTEYFKSLNRKGLINKFVLEYVNTHRQQLLSDYANIDAYIARFVAKDDFLEGLYTLAESEKIERNAEQINISKPWIQNNVKALIARYLWDTTAFFKINNQINPIYQKAMELITNRKFEIATTE